MRAVLICRDIIAWRSVLAAPERGCFKTEFLPTEWPYATEVWGWMRVRILRAIYADGRAGLW